VVPLRIRRTCAIRDRVGPRAGNKTNQFTMQMQFFYD
jgi:hypothetical protein